MTGKTVLFGSGKATGRVASELINHGIEVTIATPRSKFAFEPASDTAGSAAVNPELLTRSTLKDCRWAAGVYHLTFEKEGPEHLSRQADNIILCDDYRREPEFEPYGLKPSGNVTSLSRLSIHTGEKADAGGSVVFLSGVYEDSHPAISREIMEAALRLKSDRQRKVYILTGNLKVAAQGLEALYRSARQAGVTFFKLNREKPVTQQHENGRAEIVFKDPITGHLFRLSPELLVVDERLCVSETTHETARVLGIDSDTQGYAQSDNVHRMTVLTNRRGMLAAGPSRAVLAPENLDLDIQNTLLSVIPRPIPPSFEDTPYAEIFPGGCVRCLTCYRLCPFGAIKLNGRLQVARDLCEGCGICRAECPKGAIELKNPAAGTFADPIATVAAAGTDEEYDPVIYAFCCSRSSYQALKLAGFLGCSLPEGLRTIEVPCAGAISTGDLLHAYQNNADGVIVLTCHVDNCHAEKGNQLAHQRAAHMGDLLDQVGIDRKRIMTSTLASNMGIEFSKVVNDFYGRLKKMGPLLQG